MTELPFTHRPGRRERHLRRRHGNALFAWPPEEVSPERLLDAQREDHESMLAFRGRFRDLVQRALDLPQDAGSEPVLALKSDLELAYEESFGLPEDQGRERAALGRLIGLCAQAVRRAAGSDPLALAELAEEGEARELHLRNLEHPLVADLLDPSSPMAPGDLVPAMLCAGAEELECALSLFDPDGLAELARQAADLARDIESRGGLPPGVGERLARILASAPTSES